MFIRETEGDMRRALRRRALRKKTSRGRQLLIKPKPQTLFLK